MQESFHSFVVQAAKDPDLALGLADAYAALSLEERTMMLDEVMGLALNEALPLVLVPLFAVEGDAGLRHTLFRHVGQHLRRTPEAFARGDELVLTENLYGDFLSGLLVRFEPNELCCQRLPLVRRSTLEREFQAASIAASVDRVATAVVRMVHTHRKTPPAELRDFAHWFDEGHAA